jgi:2-iminobutanoate/2-iminopropanoate deaminase
LEINFIKTDKAPAAIGAYSQAVAFGDFVWVSGQIPLDPSSGVMPEGVEAQAEQALKNVSAVLEAAGSDIKKVLKTTMFIKNMDDFPKINEIYGKYFDTHRPARACVEVARLPKDALIEIEAFAAIR